MNASNASTACPNSRKPTHLISGDTDNAEGLVVIYVVMRNGREEFTIVKPLVGKKVKKVVHP